MLEEWEPTTEYHYYNQWTLGSFDCCFERDHCIINKYALITSTPDNLAI